MTAPLVRPHGSSVNTARRMFDVLRDDAQTCACRLHGSGRVCTEALGAAMTVPVSEYDRPDRIFL